MTLIMQDIKQPFNTQEVLDARPKSNVAEVLKENISKQVSDKKSSFTILDKAIYRRFASNMSAKSWFFLAFLAVLICSISTIGLLLVSLIATHFVASFLKS